LKPNIEASESGRNNGRTAFAPTGISAGCSGIDDGLGLIACQAVRMWSMAIRRWCRHSSQLF